MVKCELAREAAVGEMVKELKFGSGGDLVSEVGPADDARLVGSVEGLWVMSNDGQLSLRRLLPRRSLDLTLTSLAKSLVAVKASLIVLFLTANSVIICSVVAPCLFSRSLSAFSMF